MTAGAASAKKLKPKKDDLDSSSHLRAWGFSRASCMKCGVLNSQVGGMLFQCGKCKRAYYCSAQCFNADLVNHQVYCNTGQLQSQPKMASSTDSTTASSSQSSSRTSSRIDKKSVRQRFENMTLTKIREETKPCDSVHVEPVGGRSEDASLDDETSLYDCSGDYDSEDSDFSYGRSPMAAPAKEHTTDIGDMNGADDGEHFNANRGNKKEKSDWTKGRPLRELDDKGKEESQQIRRNPVPGAESSSKSFPDGAASSLNNVAQNQKKVYGWEKPSWATGSPLRKTNRGDLKQSGRVSMQTKKDLFS